MKIYLVGATRPFLERVNDALVSADITGATIVAGRNISLQDFADKMSDCEILVSTPSAFEYLSEAHMKALPSLKFISTTSVGVDWIDVKAAHKLGIIVSNQRGVNAQSVAEHCIGMIFTLSKRITESDRKIREGGNFLSEDFTGIELAGKTLGIIGLGDIGARVAAMSSTLFGQVIGINKSGSKVEGVEITDLTSLLKQSDVVVVTVPLNDETTDLLSAEEFALMKVGSLLVSISREKIINKDAAIKSISSNHLGGFALDHDKPISVTSDDSYFQYDNIVVTPHSAAETMESDLRYRSMTVENIKAFLNGSPIRVIDGS